MIPISCGVNGRCWEQCWTLLTQLFLKQSWEQKKEPSFLPNLTQVGHCKWASFLHSIEAQTGFSADIVARRMCCKGTKKSFASSCSSYLDRFGCNNSHKARRSSSMLLVAMVKVQRVLDAIKWWMMSFNRNLQVEIIAMCWPEGYTWFNSNIFNKDRKMEIATCQNVWPLHADSAVNWQSGCFRISPIACQSISLL